MYLRSPGVGWLQAKLDPGAYPDLSPSVLGFSLGLSTEQARCTPLESSFPRGRRAFPEALTAGPRGRRTGLPCIGHYSCVLAGSDWLVLGHGPTPAVRKRYDLLPSNLMERGPRKEGSVPRRSNGGPLHRWKFSCCQEWFV